MIGRRFGVSGGRIVCEMLTCAKGQGQEGLLARQTIDIDVRDSM
jgi:hypothetical protein